VARRLPEGQGEGIIRGHLEKGVSEADLQSLVDEGLP